MFVVIGLLFVFLFLFIFVYLIVMFYDVNYGSGDVMKGFVLIFFLVNLFVNLIVYS